MTLLTPPLFFPVSTFKVPQRSFRSYTTFSVPNYSINYDRNSTIYRMMFMAIMNNHPFSHNLYFITIIVIVINILQCKCKYIQ